MISDYDEQTLLQKFKLTLLLSAVGDSLGWPHEFYWFKYKNFNEYYISWEKLIGGKWWGYWDKINEGDYSDDTQLTLSIARSIDSNGKFIPEYFAYLELPLWLHYERGGGRSLKNAAHSILKKKNKWNTNFYKIGNIKYENAGANGAAMRNIPIALINLNNKRNFIIDSFKNTIITHGHPRAIIGTLIIGGAQRYFLKNETVDIDNINDDIFHILESSLQVIKKDQDLNSWLNYMDDNMNFITNYKKTINESIYFLDHIKKYLSEKEIEYYKFTGALEKEYKGSGVSTTSIGIFLAYKYIKDPLKAILIAANMIKSDTDTIAAFVGSLVGSSNNDIFQSKKIRNLIYSLQDKNYFLIMGNHLWNIINNNINYKEKKILDKEEALLKIMAWEIGFHEMFWEALREGDLIIHPTLGKGIIIQKNIKKIKNRNDYLAKIIKIKFRIGQTAYFHSRVNEEGFLNESISREIYNELI